MVHYLEGTEILLPLQLIAEVCWLLLNSHKALV